MRHLGNIADAGNRQQQIRLDKVDGFMGGGATRPAIHRRLIITYYRIRRYRDRSGNGLPLVTFPQATEKREHLIRLWRGICF